MQTTGVIDSGYQLLKIYNNELIGEVKILKAENQYLIAKKMNKTQIDRINAKSDVLNYLKTQDIVQHCLGFCQLNNETHLLFKYYDYTVNALFLSHQQTNTLLMESSLIKLLLEGTQALINLFKKTSFYHPLSV